ncbi:MAG: PAS domain S-box protein, partial [Anaerolineae bacterium]|nr:PAS domain S-box protein [Anaerolineae bacterium]
RDGAAYDEPVEYQYRRKDGSTAWASVTINFICEGETPVKVVAVMHDITQRKELEERLRESEARYRKVSELASDYAYAAHVGPDGVVHMEWVTDAFERVTGYSKEEFTARDSWQVMTHPDDRAQIAEQMHTLLAGHAQQYELRLITKSGDTRWIEGHALPQWDEQQGRVVRFYGAARDITDRKQNEQHLRDLTAERERIQVLQRFVADASHDLRTPLTTVKVNLYLLEKAIAPSHLAKDSTRHLTQLREQIDHLARVLEDMLTMTELDANPHLTLRSLSIPDVLRTLIDQHHALAQEHKVTLTCQCEQNLPYFYGHEQNLSRALANILLNAIYYTPASGSVTVHAYQEGQSLVVAISDTGIGMTPEEQGHLFRRFYRGDAARRTDTGGSGLGLAISHKIVTVHEGSIEVESAPGEGSTFRVRLPLTLTGQPLRPASPPAE